MHAAGLLGDEDYRFFDASYRFLRTIEGRLRLMNSTARDTLPHDATELTKLAHLLHYPGSDALLADYDGATREIRRRFERMLEAAAASGGIGDLRVFLGSASNWKAGKARPRLTAVHQLLYDVAYERNGERLRTLGSTPPDTVSGQ